MPSTAAEHTVHLTEHPAGAGILRRRRRLNRFTIGLLAVILGLAVIDGLDVVDVYGVDDSVVSASAGGTTLRVVFPSVTRPALASPLRIEVHREGGWGGEPVTIAVQRSYLEIWDANAIIPAPASETTDGPMVLWEMEPPVGDTLVVTYEARVEPGRQTARSGQVWLVEDGERVLGVRFTTRVRP